MEQTTLRPTAEQRYADELAALAHWDRDNPKPENWQLSPRAVRLFILGTPKGQPLEQDGAPVTIAAIPTALSRENSLARPPFTCCGLYVSTASKSWILISLGCWFVRFDMT